MSLMDRDQTNYDLTLEVPEIDAALLMELLEEEDDHIEHENENCKDCEIDHEMIADDFDIHECSESSSTTYMLSVEDDMPFYWEEINEVGCELINGEDMGACNWYNMDEVEMVMRCEVVDCDCFYYGDQSCMEQQLYIPLWQ